MHGVIGAGVILSVMGGGVFTNVLAAPNAWPTEVLAPLFVCAGTEWLVPKSPVAFHSLGLLPVCIVPALCGGRSHVLAPLQLCPLRRIA